MKSCSDADWDQIEKNKDGSCKKPSLTSRIQQLKMGYEFPEDSYEYKLLRTLRLSDEESIIKKDVKRKTEEIHLRTKEVIESLTEEEALKILEYKWIHPLVKDLNDISATIIIEVIKKIEYLAQKYCTTMHEIQSQKASIKSNLVDLVDMLEADGADKEGLQEFKLILGGQK